MAAYLVTGVAGFIGHWTARCLLSRGDAVVGIDNLNDAYDPRIKEWRLAQLGDRKGYRFVKADTADAATLEEACGGEEFDGVFHLAARAGGPQSARRPLDYIEANAVGTQNVLDLCTRRGVGKLVMASTSSVYGETDVLPIDERADTSRPRSPYAASKLAAEALARAHHHVHGLDTTVLRYFTVYGPAGRPDMSLFRFVRWICEGQSISLHGDGSQHRDFTFVQDIVRGTVAATAPLGFEVINLGGGAPVRLIDALETIEDVLGRKATIRREPLLRVDVTATWASIDKADRLLGWRPRIPLREGVESLVRWYLENRAWAVDLEPL